MNFMLDLKKIHTRLLIKKKDPTICDRIVFGTYYKLWIMREITQYSVSKTR